MDAITYALNHIRHTIPDAILQIAFSPNSVVRRNNYWFNINETQSIDYNIRDRVIESRVNVDLDLFGGNQVPIDLRGVPYEQYDWQTRVYRIPPEVTGHRKIVSIQSLVYINFYNMSGYVDYQRSNDLLSATSDLYNSISQMPIVQTANCMLLGDNTVMVRDDVVHLHDNLALICIVENEAGLANIAPQTYPLYAELVEYATKAYIYNSTIVELDQGYLMGGQNLGRIRDMIEDYADANELYRETLMERWRKASFTNDRSRFNNLIRTMVGRGH